MSRISNIILYDFLKENKIVTKTVKSMLVMSKGMWFRVLYLQILIAWKIGTNNFYQESLWRATPYFIESIKIQRKCYLEKRWFWLLFMNFLKTFTINCDIPPRNASGISRFSVLCVCRGGAQDIFVTGKRSWLLDVVKCWRWWGTGEKMNTIIRYLLEETSKFDSNLRHYLCMLGYDSRLFNQNASSIGNLSRVINSVW